MKKLLFLTLTTGLAAWILSPSNSSAQASKSASLLEFEKRHGDIVAALQSPDWLSVKDVLLAIKAKRSKHEACDLEAPIRILYGHSALATGENSVAVEQFYCATDSFASATIKEWLVWTQKLAKSLPNLASAHYLYGDALARNGDLAKAKTEFDKAIALNSHHVLALNARGVTEWLLYESDTLKYEEHELKAIDDFITANKIDTGFADAWANRGVIGLRDKSELAKASEKFNRAFDLDSTYWLALNGRAVAAGASGKYWDFQSDVKIIELHAPNTPFVGLNTGNSSFLSEGIKQRGFEAGIKATIPIITPIPVLLELNLNWSQDRGGIFIYLKDGVNLVVDEENQPRFAGTWFALNYPPQIVRKIEDK